MSDCRVQKLLFSEFCDFDDMVLIESPFAQTTKDGKGIRQVHIGLTPSKLVLATDVLPPVEKNSITYVPGIDPEIETFELIAIYPVTCVNLSIYRRRKRQALKARFCNNKVLYFELGGFQRRQMFWNLWCEKVRFLCPEDSNSSKSETSVATSSTRSTLYLLDRKLVSANGLKQLWCKFGPANKKIDSSLLSVVFGNNAQQSSALVQNWTDRYLYFGKHFSDLPLDYKPIMHPPTEEEFIKVERQHTRSKLTISKKSLEVDADKTSQLAIGDSVRINRFGSGIFEGCRCGLYLTADEYAVPHGYSTACELEKCGISDSSLCNNRKIESLIHSSVKLWEYGVHGKYPKKRVKHRRRYGLNPQPLFLSGLGPWNVTPGSRFSVQVKRASSDVHLQTVSADNEFSLPMSRRQLVATISCTALIPNNEKRSSEDNFLNSPRKPIIYFWTPDYWYRPRSPKDAYLELQRHLNKIKNYHETVRIKSLKNCKCSKRFFRKSAVKHSKESDEESDTHYYGKKSRKRKQSSLYNLFGRRESLNFASCCWPRSLIDNQKLLNETSLHYLKRMLRTDVTLTAWDFDSTTLAEQLTMIDRDLFLKVAPEELEIIVWKRSTKNAPNISALVAFSHRIYCLVGYEILKDETERIRARLIARFINVADKCHRMCNFQSCRTILCGLQSSSIYRLHATWAYVRKKHATKYQIFEYLCRLYRDPRLPSYQKVFFIFSQTPPFLPCINDIIARLLDKIPEYEIQMLKKGTKTTSSAFSKSSTTTRTKSISNIKSTNSTCHHSNNLISKFLQSINIFNSNATSNIRPIGNIKPLPKRKKMRQIKTRRAIKLKALFDFYKPLHEYEDTRLKCLKEVVEFLERSQIGAINYCFNYNELARNYLLKARYKEDRDNFINSLRVEPTNYVCTLNKK